MYMLILILLHSHSQIKKGHNQSSKYLRSGGESERDAFSGTRWWEEEEGVLDLFLRCMSGVLGDAVLGRELCSPGTDSFSTAVFGWRWECSCSSRLVTETIIICELFNEHLFHDHILQKKFSLNGSIKSICILCKVSNYLPCFACMITNMLIITPCWVK